MSHPLTHVPVGAPVRGRTPPTTIAWVYACGLLLTAALPFALIGLLQRGTDTSNTLVLVLLGAWLVGALAVVTVAILDALALLKRRDVGALAGSGMLVKLAGIPFFVVNFLFLAGAILGVLFFSSMFAAGGMTAIGAVVVTPVLVVGTYLVMLPTSSYGIACLVLLRRDGVISSSCFATHLVMHLVFVVDVVSAVLVRNRVSRLLSSMAARG